MEPLDLRNRPPRSCYAELDGLMLMPRTIDKLARPDLEFIVDIVDADDRRVFGDAIDADA